MNHKPIDEGGKHRELLITHLTAGGDSDPSNSMRRHHVEDLQKTVGRAAATSNRWDLRCQTPVLEAPTPPPGPRPQGYVETAVEPLHRAQPPPYTLGKHCWRTGKTTALERPWKRRRRRRRGGGASAPPVKEARSEKGDGDWDATWRDERSWIPRLGKDGTI